RAPGPDELEPFTLELIEWGASLSPDDAAAGEAAFALATSTYLRLFDHCDVVLTPTVTRPPWPIGTLAPDLGRAELIARTEELIGYTPIHNIAGNPAMSVPLEQVDGLPVGMHLAAAPGQDAALLRLAYELEEVRPWAALLPRRSTVR
ncbi:MAG: amidase family protein, partial [Aquihabitans sp.]